MNLPPATAMLAALALLGGCATAPSSTVPSKQLVALDACRTQAEASRYTPEGRGLVGAADYDRYVAECMRTSRANR